MARKKSEPIEESVKEAQPDATKEPVAEVPEGPVRIALEVELPPYVKPIEEVAVPKEPESVEPPPPEPPKSEPPPPEAVESPKVELDKTKFYRLCEALVTNKASQFSGFAAVRRIGEMFGISEYPLQLKKWEEIKEFLSKNPH